MVVAEIPRGTRGVLFKVVEASEQGTGKRIAQIARASAARTCASTSGTSAEIDLKKVETEERMKVFNNSVLRIFLIFLIIMVISSSQYMLNKAIYFKAKFFCTCLV